MDQYLEVTPQSGRFCVRKTSDGFATVGVLHFPEKFRPEEGTGYPLIWADGQLRTVPIAMGKLAPHQLDDGFGGWSQSPIWRDIGEAGFVARFVKAFDNGWSALSVTRSDPFAGMVPDAHRFADGPHYWVDIHDGQVTAIPSPVPPKSLQGTALSQLCTNFCVWPNGEGEPHTLPALSSSTRRAFSMLNSISLLVANDKLDRQDANHLIRDSAALQGLGASLADDDYLQYLKVAGEFGMLDANGAYSTSAFARKNDFTSLVASAMQNGELENSAVRMMLRTISKASQYEARPTLLSHKDWDHVFADGQLFKTRWCIEPGDPRWHVDPGDAEQALNPEGAEMIRAQKLTAGGWVSLGPKDLQDLAVNVAQSFEAIRQEGMGVKAGKIPPLWALLDRKAPAAEEAPTASRQREDDAPSPM